MSEEPERKKKPEITADFLRSHTQSGKKSVTNPMNPFFHGTSDKISCMTEELQRKAILGQAMFFKDTIGHLREVLEKFTEKWGETGRSDVKGNKEIAEKMKEAGMLDAANPSDLPPYITGIACGFAELFLRAAISDMQSLIPFLDFLPEEEGFTKEKVDKVVRALKLVRFGMNQRFENGMKELEELIKEAEEGKEDDGGLPPSV